MDELLCGDCGDALVDPVVLPCCGAAVCIEHVGKACRTCGLAVDRSQVKKNRLLALRRSRESPCPRCDQTQPSQYCIECHVALCPDCSDSIHSIGRFQHHTRVSSTLQSTTATETCEQHTGLPLEFYCLEDCVVGCADCVKTHNGHKIEEIETVSGQVVSDLTEIQESVDSKIATVTDKAHQLSLKLLAFTHEADRLKSAIKGEFQVLKDLLSAKEDEVMRAASTLVQDRMTRLVQASSNADKAGKRLETISEVVRFALAQQAIVIVDSAKYIHYLMETAPGVPETVCVPPIPALTIDTSKVALAIHTLTLSTEKDAEPDIISSPRSPPAEPTPRNSLASSKSPMSRAALSKTMTVGMSSGVKSSAKSCMSQKMSHRLTMQSKSEDSRTQTANTLDAQPLAQRTFVRKLPNTSSIHIAWTHPISTVPGLQYILEYGIGARVGNIEQFRQVYQGPAHTCIVTDLLPKTSYRFRVAAVLPSGTGDWSEVVTIATFDQQCVDLSSCGQHASLASNRAGEKWLTFEKAGIVTGVNPVWFGKTGWEAVIVTQGDETLGSLKVGVVAGKTKAVIGCSLGFKGKGTLKVRVSLDVDSRCLTCYTPSHPEGELFTGLPEGPLTPALLSKPGKSNSVLKALLVFDLPYEVDV